MSISTSDGWTEGTGQEKEFVEATGESVGLTISLLPTIAGASSAPAP
jgi:hypothetical protein